MFVTTTEGKESYPGSVFPLRLVGHDVEKEECREDVADERSHRGTTQAQHKLNCQTTHMATSHIDQTLEIITTHTATSHIDQTLEIMTTHGHFTY